MPRVKLRNWSPGQVHRQHRPGETRQVTRVNSAVAGINEPAHRRMQRLPSVSGNTKLAGRKVHVETQLSPQLRRDVVALRHIYFQTGTDEIHLDFLGRPDTLPKALSHKQKVIKVREQSNASLPPTHYQLSHYLGKYPRCCRKSKREAVINIITALPLESDKGP
jgi:hypothetical protein